MQEPENYIKKILYRKRKFEVSVTFLETHASVRMEDVDNAETNDLDVPLNSIPKIVNQAEVNIKNVIDEEFDGVPIRDTLKAMGFKKKVEKKEKVVKKPTKKVTKTKK